MMAQAHAERYGKIAVAKIGQTACQFLGLATIKKGPMNITPDAKKMAEAALVHSWFVCHITAPTIAATTITTIQAPDKNSRAELRCLNRNQRIRRIVGPV
jgi:hypothetical protein